MEQKKPFLNVFLTPFIIAVVGISGTFFITRQQIKSAELSMETQIQSSERQAKSAQQVKILEIFSGKITSPNIKEREIAVRILSTLDKDLSEKLAKAIVESSNGDTLIQNIATQFLHEKSYVVIGSYNTLKTAKDFANTLELKNLPYPVKIYRNAKNIFAVCLGGAVSNNEAVAILKFAKARNDINDSFITNIWVEAEY